MTAGSLSPGDFVFPPDSLIWRVSRERALLLGGPAAAILQVAHPGIASGVAAHSNFRRDTLGRLHRTLDAVYTITFATRDEASAMAAHVAAVHRPIRGNDPVPYDAASPDAQLWVLATLIACGLDVYESLVTPLTPAEREAHYRDMRTFGQFFGLDPAFGPPNATAFREYYDSMLRGDLLASIPICRDVATAVLRPSQPRWLALAAGPLSGIVIETLPEPVRSRLGFRSTPASRSAHRIAVTTLRFLLPHLSDRLRYTPRYLTARRRLR